MLHFTGSLGDIATGVGAKWCKGIKDDDILFSNSVFASSPHRHHNFQTGTIDTYSNTHTHTHINTS